MANQVELTLLSSQFNQKKYRADYNKPNKDLRPNLRHRYRLNLCSNSSHH